MPRSVREASPRALDEHGTVSDEWNASADRGGRDPGIGVMATLVVGEADRAATVARLGDSCRRVDRKDADPVGCLGKLVQPSRTPTCLQRSIARLGDHLRRDRQRADRRDALRTAT